MIGWHVNQGEDRAAQFIEASQMAAQYNQPGVVDRLFRAGSAQAAVALYNRELGQRRNKELPKRVTARVIQLTGGSQVPKMYLNELPEQLQLSELE